MEALNKSLSLDNGYPKRAGNELLGADCHIFKCRDKQIGLGSKTIIMGVLNLTPDSFFDGGNFTSVDRALRHVEKMITEGADIIDIGGESTRPGSLGISIDEECERVMPVITEIKKNFDAILSIDTTKSRVADEAMKAGVSIINDISGLKFDDKIADVASEYRAGLVLSHTTASPAVMQNNTHYNSLIEDIKRSLSNSVSMAMEKGVDNDCIIVDPGFGFGKTTEQNLMLLKNLGEICALGKPVLIGTSNKSFIGNILNAETDDRAEGTAATVAIGIANGASVIRVHDIGYMKKVAAMVDAVMNVN